MTRRRLAPDQSRELILDATELLMLREGYAAVTARRVAAEGGLTAPLVHYYYRTTDDLLLAVYRRLADRTRVRLEAALSAKQPLRALWAINSSPEMAGLAVEFLALANHRKTIRTEVARIAAEARATEAQAVARIGDRLPTGCPPDVAALLIAALGRALVMEATIGITESHEDARGYAERLIAMLEPSEGDPGNTIAARNHSRGTEKTE